MGRLATILPISSAANTNPALYPQYNATPLVGLPLSLPVGERWTVEAISVRSLSVNVTPLAANTEDWSTAQLLVFLSGLRLLSIPLTVTQSLGAGIYLMDGGDTLASPMELDQIENLQVQFMVRAQSGGTINQAAMGPNVQQPGLGIVLGSNNNQLGLYGTREALPKQHGVAA